MSFIICHVADNTGHIAVARQFAGPLPPVARYDLIAPVLTGTHQGGLVDAASLDGGHKALHLHIVPDAEWVVLERVELREVQIDDLLLFPTGGVPGLGRLLRHGRGRGLLLGRGRRPGCLVLLGGLG